MGTPLIAGVVLLLLVSFHASAEIAASFGNVIHLDGAFQSMATMARLCQGQVPGRDFDMYLGAGPLLLLAPVFVLKGCSFGASLYTTHLTVSIAFYTALFTLGWIAFGALGMKHRASACIAIVVSVRLVLLHPGNIGLYLETFRTELSYPGNSLLMLRYAVIFIAAWFVLVEAFRNNWSPVAYGLAAGAAVGWSFDTGIPVAFSLIVVWLARQDWSGTSIWRVLLLALGCVLGGVITAAIISGGDLTSFIEFRSNVADAQFWYYAPFGEDSRYFGWRDVVTYFWREYNLVTTFALLTTPVASALALIKAKRNRFAAALFVVSASAFLSAALSEFGGHLSDRYYTVSLMIWPFAVISCLGLYYPQERSFRWPAAASSAVRVSVPAIAVVGSISAAFPSPPSEEFVKNWRWVPELESRLLLVDLPDVRLARAIPEGASHLSTYFNVVDVLVGSSWLTRVDSLIHAFGRERARWEQLVSSAAVDFVLTTRPKYAGWHEWLVTANWPFFRAVLEHYTPAGEGRSLQLWSRGETASSEEAANVSCVASPVSPSEVRVEVRANKGPIPQIIDVRLEMESDLTPGLLPINGRRKLLVVENKAARFVAIRVGLDPHAESIEFPVLATAAVMNRTILGFPSDRISLRPGACTALRLNASTDAISAMLEIDGVLTPYDLTDQNWIRGIGIRFPGFFIATEERPSNLSVGDEVAFAGSGNRRITRIYAKPDYTEILVDGPLLDPKTDGYPNGVILRDR